MKPKQRQPGDPVRTPRVRRRLLEALIQGASIGSACEAAGVSRQAALKWRREDPVFAEEWEDAHDHGTDRIEDEAFRRAVKGVRKPVVSAGQLVTYERIYSDKLIETLLRARRPEKYKGNAPVDPSTTTTLTGAAERLQHRLLSILERSMEATDGKP